MRETRYILVRDVPAVRDKIEEIGGFGWASMPISGWRLIRVYNQQLLTLAKRFPSDAKVIPKKAVSATRIPQSILDKIGPIASDAVTVYDVLSDLVGNALDSED